MDLIVQRTGREDIAVAHPLTVDFAVGGENDYAVELSIEEYKEFGDINFVYFEGTEWGGIVDKVTVMTERNRVELYGRAWSGVIASRIIQPDAGQDYYSVSGSVSTVLTSLLSRLGLTDQFKIGTCADKNVTYTFDRYCDAYAGICKMLAAHGMKLKIIDDGVKVEIAAVEVINYADLDEWSSSQMDFEVARPAEGSSRYLYLICLGSGELKDRLVRKLRLDLTNGSITTVTSYTLDAHSYEEVFDYPNAEEADELISKGKDRLTKFYKDQRSIFTTFSANDVIYDVGDIVGAKNEVLNISASMPITTKTLYISEDGRMTIDCRTGGR